jgi:hypothetical protein
MIFNVFVVFHIISGGIALLTGIINMVAAKGKKIHIVAGNIFFWGMLGVFISSMYMSITKYNWFLMCVGFFSFYLTCSGIIASKSKTPKLAEKLKIPHLLVCVSGILAGIAMLTIAVIMFLDFSIFGLVPGMFGLISLALSISDYRQLIGLSKLKKPWLVNHAFRMAGAFTSTLTAFIVVNIQIEQQWILWLLPTFVVIPATKRIVSKYKIA